MDWAIVVSVVGGLGAMTLLAFETQALIRCRSELDRLQQMLAQRQLGRWHNDKGKKVFLLATNDQIWERLALAKHFSQSSN